MAPHIETLGRTLNDLATSAVVWFKISTKEKVLSLQLILGTDRDGFVNQMLLPLPRSGSIQEATGEKSLGRSHKSYRQNSMTYQSLTKLLD